MSPKHSCVTLLLSISTSDLYFCYIGETPDSFQCFISSPQRTCDVCSVMQVTGRGFFISKYGLRPTTLRGGKISTLLPLTTKTKCLFDVKLRLLH